MWGLRRIRKVRKVSKVRTMWKVKYDQSVLNDTIGVAELRVYRRVVLYWVSVSQLIWSTQSPALEISASTSCFTRVLLAASN